MSKLYRKVILITILTFTIISIAACGNNTQYNSQQIPFENNWNSSLIIEKPQ
jgi:hypothetical protein